MRKSVFLFFFFFQFLMTGAQVFPVAADLRVNAATLESISTLGGFGMGSQPLQVRLMLNDLSIPNREVTLRFTFAGEYFSLATEPMDIEATMVLESGVPYVVPDAILNSFFRYEKLSGIRFDTFASPLPEGYYELCVEVYDVASGKVLSARVCETFFHDRREPPLLLSPQQGEKVPVTAPQAVYFQWTPRGVPSDAVLYRFSLVEIWDTSQDPRAAFLASPPIFETTTPTPGFLYDLQATPLIPDRRYAWRIQELPADVPLRDARPLSESEIFWFDHVMPCSLPGIIGHEVKGRSQANISWEDDTTVLSEFTVRYRKAGEGYQWFYTSTPFNWLTLWGLEGETKYEYQLMRKCELSETVFSRSRFFTTGTVDTLEDVLECGIAPSTDVHTQVALPVLRSGEAFTAGDFTIVVHKVKGADGRFSGQGEVSIPYLANIRVGVRFTNVFINQDRALVSGVVHTVYDKDWTNVLDVDTVLDEVEDIVDVVTGDDRHTVHIPDFEITEDQIEVADGKVHITAPDGSVITLDHDRGDVILITDSAGNQWQVDQHGKISRVGSGAPGGAATPLNTRGVEYDTQGDALLTTLSGSAKAIRFFRGDDSRYAIDRADTPWKKRGYPKLRTEDGGEIYPLHKAVVTGNTEFFYAAMEEEHLPEFADSLVVKTMEGRQIPITFMDEGRVIRMELSGMEGYREEQVLLCIPEADGKYNVLATFYLHHLKQFPKVNITLVPGAMGAVPGELPTQIGELLASVGVPVMVKESAVFDPSSELWDTETPNGMLDYNGSGLLADYPVEFRNYQKTFIASSHFEDAGACYLFFPGQELGNTAGIAGFMPRGRQWGYVFAEGSIEEKGSQAEVALHEIGHGLLGLTHPQEGQESGRLMGPGTGTALSYLDWKALNSDGLKLPWLDPDNEKELAGRVWFTPDWEPFKVPGTRVISSKGISRFPDGVVPGFKIGGQYYYAKMGESGFLGYYNSKGEDYEITEVPDHDPDDKVYLFKDDGGCGYNKYYSATYSAVQADMPNLNLADGSIYTYEAIIPCDGTVTTEDIFMTRICEQGGDHTLPEAAVEMLSGMLARAHSERLAMGNRTGAPAGAFHHLINFREDHLGESQQIIEDKLFLLKSLTGINFYVLGYDTSGHGALKDPERVAKRLLTANPTLQQEPTVLIMAGYNTLGTSAGMVECMAGGMALSDEGLLTPEHFTPGTYGDLYSLILAAFTALEKPYTLHRFFLRSSGEVLHITQRPEEGKGVRGVPFLYAVEFYRSPHLNKIAQMQQSLRSLLEKEGELLEHPDHLERFCEIRKEWVSEMNMLTGRAMTEEEAAFGESPELYWIKEKSPLGVLREGLLDDPEMLNAYYGTVSGTERYAERWKIQFGNRAVLTEDHFYDYNSQVLVDMIVYTTLDLASMVPHPYVETGAEIAGLIYATYRGDLESAAIYGASLVIPFSGLAKLKGIAPDPGSLQKRYAAFARRDGDGFRVVVKSVDEADPNELQLTLILSDREEVARIVEAKGIEPYEHPERIKRLLGDMDLLVRTTNRIEVDWIRIPECYKCERDALAFWKDESKETVHYMQNKYYIKHDLDSGELLVGDVETGEMIGFFNGVENKNVFKKYTYRDVIRISKIYFGRSDIPTSVVFNSSNGAEIISDPDRCTTLIGNFAIHGRGSGGDMKGVIEELLLNLKHQDFNGRPNGFNLLNVSDATWGSADNFFEEYNRIWLQMAVDREDVIVSLTDPMDLEKVIKNSQLLDSGAITTLEELKSTLLKVNESRIDEYITGFGKELRLIFENGYTYDHLLKKFVK